MNAPLELTTMIVVTPPATVTVVPPPAEETVTVAFPPVQAFLIVHCPLTPDAI
jgi:hypothetical protein